MAQLVPLKQAMGRNSSHLVSFQPPFFAWVTQCSISPESFGSPGFQNCAVSARDNAFKPGMLRSPMPALFSATLPCVHTKYSVLYNKAWLLTLIKANNIKATILL